MASATDTGATQRPPSLSGRTIFITGASEFIGRALCGRLSELGATVTGVDLVADPANGVVAGSTTKADSGYPPSTAWKAHATVIVIGIDPHESTHTATAVDPDTVGDLRRARFQIDDLTTRIKTELAASGTKLLKIPGVGIVTAARTLARTGDPTRFVNEAAFANYSGTAPIEVASADKQRHRLSRSGDRTLNSAIHIPRSPKPEHRAAMATPTTNAIWLKGKTSHEAMRCLKRQVAKRLWRTMRDDQASLPAIAAAS